MTKDIPRDWQNKILNEEMLKEEILTDYNEAFEAYFL